MKSRLSIVLLLLIHVPFLIGYVFGLRTDPAYQFGPVAWCFVAVLCWRRNGGRVESAGRFSAIRVLIDLLCVTLAIVTDQFGFDVLGGLDACLSEPLPGQSGRLVSWLSVLCIAVHNPSTIRCF